jgi:hypothetical protein
MKKVTCIALLYLSFGSLLVASTENGPDRRYYYGTYIGVDLGIINQFEGSPFMGYMLTPRLHTGAGVKYQYYYSRELNNVFRAHLYGPFIYSDLVAVKNLNELFPFKFIEAAFIIHGELNVFSLPSRHFDRQGDHAGTRFFQPNGLIGAGLRTHAGGNSFIHIILMMDVSGDDRLVYTNPVLRFGFIF